MRPTPPARAGSAAAGVFAGCYFIYFPGTEPLLVLAGTALPLAAVRALQRPFAPSRAAQAGALAAVFAVFILLAPRCWRLKPPAPRPSEIILTEGSFLAVTGGGPYSYYEDGRLLHAPEDTGPEELAHIPLLSIKKNPRVLLSGSGAFFLLPEVLKHKPASVEIAEPDRFKAAALERAAGDAGDFTLTVRDPRRLAGPARYDIIFQTVASPDNAAMNRFFTLEYFRQAASLLRPGGLLVFQLPFAQNYVPAQTAYAAACVLASAEKVFTCAALIPGQKLTVLLSEEPIALDPAALAAAYIKRGIKNRIVVPSAFPFMLDPYRRAWAENELVRVKDPPLNTDLDPLAYFRFWRAWLSMVVSPSSLLGLAALAAAALLAALKLFKSVSFLSGDHTGEAFLMGFCAMALETALLLAFQARTGRLGPELGLFFAAFMAGGAAGAWAGKRTGTGLPAAELASAALAFACAGLAPALMAASRPAFWFLAAASGAASGYFFALAAGNRGAEIYSLDLLGGAAGGLATAAFCAPLAGIAGALYLSGAAGLAALGCGVLGRKTGRNAGAATSLLSPRLR
jgi:spermidine synthase